MAKHPPRDPKPGRAHGEGRSLSDDPIARNLIIMVDKMKVEPVPDDLQRLMDDLAKKLGGQTLGGPSPGDKSGGGSDA